MRLTVLGTGYVGLVAGAGFSNFGNDVTCVDVDADKIERLKKGILPIYEPGLDQLVARNFAEGRLMFSTDVTSAVHDSDVVFIAVGTPSLPDGSADLSQVLTAATTIGKSLTGYTVVVTKSTVPVGTAKKVHDALSKVAKHPFAVVSNPEFLKEGDAVNDFMKPDRVVIGADDPKARDILRYLYSPFVRATDRILMMDPVSAELTKYACNSYLATRISFMNDVANLCERVGADVEMVRLGMGSDQRIGSRFLFPGIGYGGSCFPKDVKAAMYTARDVGHPLEILESVHRVNERQKMLLAEKVLNHFSGTAAKATGKSVAPNGKSLEGKVIAIWGLAFKPGTDDIREAPAISIITRLMEAGAKIQVHDPVAREAMTKVFGERIIYAANNYEAATGAHALLLCTEWTEYRRPNFKRLKTLMADLALFDGRNQWEPEEVRSLGFTYYGVGRP